MKYKYDTIVYNVEDEDDFLYIKKFLSDNRIHTFSSNTIYPIYLFIYLNDRHIKYYIPNSNTIEYSSVMDYIDHQNDNQYYINNINNISVRYNIEPFVYDKNTVNKLKQVVKFGIKVPSYKSRRKRNEI